MVDNKIILVQLWLGDIPDYFWHHYETTKNLRGFDFLFVTDQDITLDSQNYKVVKTTREEVENKVSRMLEINFKLKNNKKSCDLKASYGDLFFEYVREYDYFGCYDIDTLFGDLNQFVSPYLGEFDFISVGDEVFHNRLSGPFLLIKNTQELRSLYKGEEFISCFEKEGVQCFEEHWLSNRALEKYKVKIIYSINTEVENGGKNTYDCFWTGGRVFVNREEKLLYHFYRKNQTKLSRIGNLITANFNKPLVDDFYWVVSFTKNYETLFINLLKSIKKYSNRKCIIYSINYNFVPDFQDLGNSQFIFKRIDIPEGDKDGRGRDINIITSKPLINIDVINSFPGKKFVNIDSDIYFTVNSDDISKYFGDLENYPLINSHVHDVIYLSGVRPDEEWTSSLHVLAGSMGVKNEIFPRRKTNIIVFDERSKWFFEEQMELYHNFKNTTPGILALHDEDTANALLWKYDLRKCLPLLDAEEVDTISMEKFHSYSYSMTVNLSPFLVLPKNENEVLFFHGIKNQDHYDRIEKTYGKEVIDSEEIVILYSNNDLRYEKNSFLAGKKIQNVVDFIIFDLEGNEIFNFSSQRIFDYGIFYVSNIILSPGFYPVKIKDVETSRVIFSSILEVR